DYQNNLAITNSIMQGNEQHIKPRSPSIEYTESLIVIVIDNAEILVVKLDDKNKLNEVRERFKNYKEITMTNDVNFTKNGVIISINDEKNFKLKEILVENKVCLKTNPNWRELVKRFKLEYGRNYEEHKDKAANKQAFIIKDCKFDLFIADEYYHDNITISSNDELTRNKGLFLKAQMEILSAASLGFSIESEKNSQDHSEAALKFYVEHFGKAEISIKEQSIELTSEFQNEVQKAIELQNSQEINKVITEFGQFMPTIVRFGGRLYYKDTTNMSKHSINNNKTGSANLSICGKGIEVQNNFGTSSKGKSIMQQKISAIFGGDKKKMYEGKEAEWKASLQDFRSWEPIEFRKPVSIFEFLEEDLKKKIREIIGKRIIYSNVQDYEFKINNLRNIVSLEMPGDVQKIFSNPDIDSQVFATIFNTDENNDVFAYILYTPEPYDVPKVIINCIQSNKKQQRVCQIKIGWIIVGYNLDISSALLSSDARLQTASKKIGASSNYPSEEHVFKMSEDNLRVACGAPVVSDLKPGHKHLVIDKKEYSKLPNFEFNVLSFINHPDSNILDQVEVDRNVDRKLFKKNFPFQKNNSKISKKNFPFQKNNSKKKDNDNTLPEFISLCADDKKECQQCNPEFIAKKLERFILEQPKCKNASNKELPDHCFALVFNPEAIKEQKTVRNYV
ncbi:5902_t:CDS:2, partial [Gigaspora margarita]